MAKKIRRAPLPSFVDSLRLAQNSDVQVGAIFADVYNNRRERWTPASGQSAVGTPVECDIYFIIKEVDMSASGLDSDAPSIRIVSADGPWYYRDTTIVGNGQDGNVSDGWGLLKADKDIELWDILVMPAVGPHKVKTWDIDTLIDSTVYYISG